MRLDYLLFDGSDEDDGSCSFDALASVMPERLPALVREIEAVLGWAVREFGAAGEECEWDFALHATGEGDAALDIGYDSSKARVSMPRQPDGRVTVALTVSGSPAFGRAFNERFLAED